MAEGKSQPPALDSILPGVLGFELVELGPELARGRFPVEDRVRQPFGAVHGGAYAAIAETLASVATHQSVADEGMAAIGLSNDTSFLRPVFAGTIDSEARRRHRGRTTWLWEVDHTDDDGRLCAVSRVTVAVRPAADGAGAEAR